MRIIELNKGNLVFKDKIEGFLERVATPLGNSGKIDCPKRFIGRRVYVLISKEDGIKKKNFRARKKS